VKPGPFEYFQPTTVAEAVSLLGAVSDSNLCRCTGYQNIVTAVKAAMKAMNA
jgi:aerobic-type carbon monoxide dehydrogenase small subunit (CoxS/CutS family)